MKIWLDDVRPAPEGWLWAKTVPEAKSLIQQAAASFSLVEAISCDNDLGDDLEEGYLLLDYIEELVYFNKGFWWKKTKFTVHSGNIGRLPYIEGTIKSIEKWQKQTSR
jgi:hypothetical protein